MQIRKFSYGNFTIVGWGSFTNFTDNSELSTNSYKKFYEECDVSLAKKTLMNEKALRGDANTARWL